ALYQEALVAEDSDSLLALLTPATALAIPPETVVIAQDQSSVTSLEVESTIDSVTLAQDTRVYRTTWQLRRTSASSTATFSIGAVLRTGPLVQITTPGQVQAGTLARVEARDPSSLFALASVELTAPDTGAAQPLRALGTGFHGTFHAAPAAPPPPLQMRLRSTRGDELVIAHPYQLRVPGEGVVQLMVATPGTRLLAVTVAPDGTVWAGGDHG